MPNPFGSGRGSFPARKRDFGFFGLAVEIDLRGQVTGQGTGIFENPTTDEFVYDNVYEVGTFKKGANWELYKTAAVARGANAADFVEVGDEVTVRNSAVEPFLSLFDIIFVNSHQNGGTTPITNKKIKDLRATYERGRRAFLADRLPHILLHVYKDDMPTGPHTSTLWAHYYYAIRDNGLFLRGTQAGSTGSWSCDPEEVNAWPGGIVKDIFAGTETPFGQVSGHNWHVNYDDLRFAPTMAEACLQQYKNYWNKSGGAGESIDGYIVHDIVPAYPARLGSATNLPTISNAVWTAAAERIPIFHKEAFRRVHPTLGELWTATGGAPARTWGGTSDIRTCRGFYYNYNWSSVITATQFKEDVMRAAGLNAPLAVGSENVYVDYEDYFDIADHQIWHTHLGEARVAGWEENVYITFRSMKVPAGQATGRLFWSPAMRRIA